MYPLSSFVLCSPLPFPAAPSICPAKKEREREGCAFFSRVTNWREIRQGKKGAKKKNANLDFFSSRRKRRKPWGPNIRGGLIEK